MRGSRRTPITSKPASLIARLRLGEGLDLDRHVMRIGVEQVGRARHDADVTLPEHEIAAAELYAFPPVDRLTQFCRLHVGVARRLMSRRLDCELDEARAVEPDTGAAAPQIGRAEKRLGDGDGIVNDFPRRRCMVRDNIAAALRARENDLQGLWP